MTVVPQFIWPIFPQALTNLEFLCWWRHRGYWAARLCCLPQDNIKTQRHRKCLTCWTLPLWSPWCGFTTSPGTTLSPPDSVTSLAPLWESSTARRPGALSFPSFTQSGLLVHPKSPLRLYLGWLPPAGLKDEFVHHRDEVAAVWAFSVW